MNYKMKFILKSLYTLNFSNFIINYDNNYIREMEQSRRKRELVFPSSFDNVHNSNNNDIQNMTENGTDLWESFSFKIYGKTEFYLNNLHHYTLYDIYVQACREREGSTDEENNCSSTSIKTVRTQLRGRFLYYI